MNEKNGLTIEQELNVIMELGLLKNDPMRYLDHMIAKIIQEFKDESTKPPEERDYDHAFMTLTRILLAMRQMLVERVPE